MTHQVKNHKFTFIDLFAGIGGFHLALNNLGGKCVYTSEWDKHARQTYEANFKKTDPELFENGMFVGDITLQENQDLIPEDADVICGGFPCQPFSQAGFKRGFEETRGTLFFEIAKIIRNKRPKAFFLENVRHLQKHNDGKTLETIKKILTEELGYSFQCKIVKASDFGLPTHRPRLYMIGFRNDIHNRDSFAFPESIPLQFTMSDVLKGECPKKVGYTLRVGGKGSGINDRRNWDSYLVNDQVHRLTVEEGKKMMGFPKNFIFPVSQGQAMKQLGNSVAVNAIQMAGANLVSVLDSWYESKGKQRRMERTVRISEDSLRSEPAFV